MIELDEALERFQKCDLEFMGGLANHGPMAAEALVALGHGALIAGFVDAYAPLIPPLEPKMRTRGYRTVKSHLNAHLLKVFGKRTLDAIRVRDFNSYISMRLSDAKPSTVKREMDTLNAILNDAVKNGHLETNPGLHADKIKGITPRQRFLDAEEIVRLLAMAEEAADWLPDFILWCLHSGMRRGESSAAGK